MLAGSRPPTRLLLLLLLCPGGSQPPTRLLPLLLLPLLLLLLLLVAASQPAAHPPACCLLLRLQEGLDAALGDFREAWDEVLRRAMGSEYWQVRRAARYLYFTCEVWLLQAKYRERLHPCWQVFARCLNPNRWWVLECVARGSLETSKYCCTLQSKSSP